MPRYPDETFDQWTDRLKAAEFRHEPMKPITSPYFSIIGTTRAEFLQILPDHEIDQNPPWSLRQEWKFFRRRDHPCDATVEWESGPFGEQRWTSFVRREGVLVPIYQGGSERQSFDHVSREMLTVIYGEEPWLKPNP